MINNLSIDLLDKRVVNLLDDMFIYSNIVEEHFTLLSRVFAYLPKHAFYFKLKKCSFLQNTTIFFRFDITLEGMCISNAKEKSLKEWVKLTIT